MDEDCTMATKWELTGALSKLIVLLAVFALGLWAAAGAGARRAALARDPIVPTAQLTPSDTGERLQSVVVAGNYVFAAAPQTSGAAGPTQGAIFVFAAPAGGWSGSLHEVAELTAGSGASTDELGWSLAVSPDGQTVVAGAYGSSPAAVYAFSEPAGGWAGRLHQSAELVAADPVTASQLGWSVTMDGDNVVAGDPAASAVYVFARPADGWSGTVADTAKLTSTDPTVYQGSAIGFGWTVAASSQTIVVGEVPAAFNWPGVAYVYTEPAGGWRDATQSARLTASSGTLMHQFPGPGAGQVAVSDDGAIVAVPGWVPGRPAAIPGAIFVYAEPAGGWAGTLTESARLSSSTGTSVADPVMSGSTIFAGNGVQEYAYLRPAGGWLGDQTESATLTAAVAGPLGQVSAAGPYLVAGGSLAGSTAAALGDAYLFTEPAGGWSGAIHETAELSGAGPSTNGSAANVFSEPSGGWSSEPASATVSPSGDPNAVTLGSVAASGPTVVATPDAGVPFEPFAQGPAYVFTEPGGGWAPEAQAATLSASDRTALGPAAVSGPTVIAAGGGKVYVFAQPSGGWNGPTHESAILSDPRGALSSAAVAGPAVVAGSDVFTEPASGWAGAIGPSAHLAAPRGDGLGGPVAIVGTTVVAESSPDAPGGADTAFVYQRPADGWSGTIQPAAILDGGAGLRFGTALAFSGRMVTALGTAGFDGAPAVANFVEPAHGWAGTLPPNATIFNDWSSSPLTSAVAADHGTVAVVTTYGNDKYMMLTGGTLEVFDGPANGWAHGSETAPTAAISVTASQTSVALEPHTAFLSGEAITVLALAGVGPPAVSGLRVSGLSDGRPTLRVKVYGGIGAPALRSVVILLPRGLSVSRHIRRRGRGISIGGATRHSVSLTHGRLRLTLTGSPRAVTITLGRGVVAESAALQRRVTSMRARRRHRSHGIRLAVSLTAVDLAGTATRLRAVATVR